MQQVAAMVQYASNVWNALGQEITQEVAALQQQLDHILGIYPSTQNQSFNPAVTQPDSPIAKSYASGSGSGSVAATTAHENPHPRLDASADVSGSGGGSAYPTYSGSATVTGKVWLDNNGDGSIDSTEMDYAGATVDLWRSEDNGATWSVADSDITSNVTQGYNYSLHVGYGYPWPSSYLYKIQVVFPSTFAATIPGTSQINAQGYSQTFSLGAGGTVYTTAGLCSLNVNAMTNSPYSDDPNGPTQQNTVTLRDSIETDNNGGGASALNDITFVNPLNGQPLTGTITLQKALDAITRNRTISGPGAGNLTIQGQGNAGNPFRIFQVTAGVNSTISGLTITGGYKTGPGGGGGGVASSGTLKLSNDRITGNTATYGGGILGAGAAGRVTVSGGTITQNKTSGVGNLQPQGGGGIWVSSGSLTLKNVSVGNNHADNGGFGGGMFIAGGTVTISGGAFQYNHTGKNGGGIYNNSGGTLTLTNNAQFFDNAAVNNGGGMYLNNQSTTTFNGCTVASNTAGSGQGNGVFQYFANQNNQAKVTIQPGGLTDHDDPGGKPFQGT